jgi:hypothetical protein
MTTTYNMDPNELVFMNDAEKSIYSGGYKVNSILMDHGISPIITLNTNISGGGIDEENINGDLKEQKVSSLFENIVVPNWALYYPSIIQTSLPKKEYDMDENDGADEIDHNLFDELFELAQGYNKKNKFQKTHKKYKRLHVNKKTKKQKSM